MRTNSYLIYCFFLILAAGITTSCEKGSPEKEFLKGGEGIYTGRPEALESFAGYKRTKLAWYLVSDPKINKAKVFWNNPTLPDGQSSSPGDRNPGRDSLVIDIQRTSGNQLIEVVIDRLLEGVYTFNVFTFDKDGNNSIKSEVIGEAYGDTYQSSISNRPIDSAEYHASTKAVHIKWFGVAQQAVVVNIEYTDIFNQLKKLAVKKAGSGAFNERDVLPNYKNGTAFKYRTGYSPTASGIDTFYTDYREVVPTLYIPPPPPPAGPSNLALGTKVSASSSATQALTDGDRSNTARWQPNSGERADLNVWFYVDLLTVKEFNSTHIYFTKDPARITYHEVLYTDASVIDVNTKWKRAYIKFGAPDAEEINSGLKDGTANPKARYVKVNIGLRDEATNINVSELEIYKK
jgi:hypothetical protein